MEKVAFWDVKGRLLSHAREYLLSMQFLYFGCLLEICNGYTTGLLFLAYSIVFLTLYSIYVSNNSTPVNVLRMDKDLFEKYIMKGSNIGLKLREKANTERFGRGISIMDRHGDFMETAYKKGDRIFGEDEIPTEAFIVKEGLVDVNAAEHNIYTVKKGRLFGVQSHVLKRNRKAAAVCKTDTCVIKSMSYEKLQELADKYPELQDTLNHLALRQEFRRAMVLQRKKSFPQRDQLKEAFDEVDADRSGTLNADEIHSLMKNLGMSFSDKDL